MKSNLNNYSELQKRVIVAVLGALLMVSAICYNEWTYFAIFFGICMLSLLEFYKLLGLDGNLPLKSFGTFNGLFIYTISFLIEKYHLNTKYYLLIFIGLACVYFIKLYVKKDSKPFANIAFTFLGILYIAVPFALLNSAVFSKGTYSFHIVLGCILLIWASDTGAYFSGKAFGKRKLFQRVSPKKTWEGSIGGGLVTLLVSYCFSFLFTDLATWKWLCIAVIIVVAGTYGDLVESLFKRSINIKDSGSVLPGHGGFLDRFDSLLLASPFITVFIKLLEDY